MTEKREIEAKFEVDRSERETLLDLRRVGRFEVRERRSIVQDDLYFDTTDGALASAGSTLRVRRNDAGVFMTFKGRRDAVGEHEMHVASRLEDELPLDAEFVARLTPDGPLPEAAGLSPLRRARAIVGDAPLFPVARLRNERVMLGLSDAGGMMLELSIDHCRGMRQSDGREVRFDEVELESLLGDRATLIDVAATLRLLAPSLRPNMLTKLERTLT